MMGKGYSWVVTDGVTGAHHLLEQENRLYPDYLDGLIGTMPKSTVGAAFRKFAKLYSQEIDPIKLLEGVNLAEKANAKPEELSGGQKQRFSIACALVNNPKVLFLDEPTTGLDPQAKRNLWQLIRDLNSDGMTIVLTTHNMEEAEYLCDRIAIMDQGKIVAEDTPQNLILKYAPEPPQAALHGNIEDVFLVLTGHELRD